MGHELVGSKNIVGKIQGTESNNLVGIYLEHLYNKYQYRSRIICKKLVIDIRDTFYLTSDNH